MAEAQIADEAGASPVFCSQNVTAAGPFHYQIDGNNLVADVTCNGCNSLLGWKYVRVPQRNYAVQPRRFLLQLNKLLMWDGKNMLYADTRMVTFHQIPNARFFLSRQCNTHIALNEDFMIRIPVKSLSLSTH
ncbi:uncharacterized protein LOC114322752 [Camellia sinensis]|uniref:uncharacterized protein LOC114322752 n=1 Tax=Camellia sinensis TaxID=4442 RepID=UPI001035B1C3|nr:uncharacterized protein LOC114322752 [Camellia sinensis]